MKRAFTNVLTDDVEQTARFYEELLGMKRSGDFGWFVILTHDDMPRYEIGILDRDHETIPETIVKSPGGSILTFVVAELADVVERATAMRAEIIQEPTYLPYGQRRLMVRDPAGSAIDISSPIR